MVSNTSKPADNKRTKISKAQQMTMLEVLVASLVLGTCMVMSLFLIKYIKFNTRIISEKNEAIGEYDQTIRNVGVCVDKDRNGRLSNEEIEGCDPNAILLSEVSGSLRANVLSLMAENTDLELVARQRNEGCYDATGERIDFNKLYEQSTDDVERQQYMQSAKICSALRVIPDALPAQRNTEALMASLNQIFILTGKEPDNLSPGDGVVSSRVAGVVGIPVNMRLEGSANEVVKALIDVERSIREFDIDTATIEWTARGIGVQASARAYYLDDAQDMEITETLYASDKSKDR